MTPGPSKPDFAYEPPSCKNAILSFPAPKVLLVILNRPKHLNCINMEGHIELERVWKWLDHEPALSVGIISGNGRAFCAGADLKEWNEQSSTKSASERTMPSSGFGGLSRRQGRKPIIAAVNGICFGGGFEMVINCDMVVASSDAAFALPEVKRGVVALAGALPRLARTAGKQRAMEIALTGRTLGAEEGRAIGIVNQVVNGRGSDEVVKAAVTLASTIASNSPDAVIVSREGVKLGWESLSVEDGTKLLAEAWYPRLAEGENIREGLQAFVEKRTPQWRPSKL